MTETAASAETRFRVDPFPGPVPLRRIARSLVASLALVMPLVACAEVGDFGRPQSSVFGRIDSSISGIARHAPTSPVSSFALTDDEQLLRNLASEILTPPDGRDRHSFTRLDRIVAMASADEASVPAHARYGTNLLATPYRSATARYSRLVEDIRNDLSRVGPFVMTAQRVIDLDRRREKALAHVQRLTDAERANAVGRIRENAGIVVQVQRALKDRTTSFRYALERLAIETPSPMAADAERALIELSVQLAAISGAPPVTSSSNPAVRG